MFKPEPAVEESYELLRDWTYSSLTPSRTLLSYVCITILWYVLFVKNNTCGLSTSVKYLVVVYFELSTESNRVNRSLIRGNKADTY